MPSKSKPFLAARIPAGLNEALDKHVEATGESRTMAAINALSKYLSWSDTKIEQSVSASDRVSLLDEKLNELTKTVKALQAKIINLDSQKFTHAATQPNNKTVIKTDNKGNQDAIDNTDNIQITLESLDNSEWMSVKEAHKKYAPNRSYEGFRKLKPEQLREEYGLEADLNRKQGQKPQRWLRKITDLGQKLTLESPVEDASGA